MHNASHNIVDIEESVQVKYESYQEGKGIGLLECLGYVRRNFRYMGNALTDGVLQGIQRTSKGFKSIKRRDRKNASKTTNLKSNYAIKNAMVEANRILRDAMAKQSCAGKGRALLNRFAVSAERV